MRPATKEFDRLMAEEGAVLAATESIAEAMERHGVGMGELAQRVGLTANHLRRLMSGRRDITVRQVAALLHALNHAEESP